MPAWIRSRAEHILAKNPSMPKGEAFAIATEQSHATGHTPRGYGTAAGKREAKKTYDTPKGDEQRANPGGLRSPKMKYKTAEAAMWAGFYDEMRKIALSGPAALEGAAKLVGKVHPPPLPAAARAATSAVQTATPAATHVGSLVGKGGPAHVGIGGGYSPHPLREGINRGAVSQTAGSMALHNRQLQASGHPGLAFI